MKAETPKLYPHTALLLLRDEEFLDDMIYNKDKYLDNFATHEEITINPNGKCKNMNIKSQLEEFKKKLKECKGVKNIKGLPSYNIQLQTADEGYYTTTIKFLKQLFFPNVESLRECGTFSNRCKTLIAGLSKTEKNNLVEMLVETFTTLLVWALLYFMFRDWDDDEGNWILRNTNYFMRRLQQEMTYAWNPETLMDILQSPTPVMSPLKDITRIIKSIGDDHILQSGPYKGQTRLKANIKRAMPIIPNWIDYVQMDTEDKKFKVFEDSFFYKNSKETSQTKN